MTDGCDISGEIAIRWISLDHGDEKSTWVQVMAWCRQATSHYLNQYWRRSLPPYGIPRPQWVKNVFESVPCKKRCQFCSDHWSIGMPSWDLSTLVQVMICHLFGIKPLPEPMLTSCQLHPKEYISVTFHLEFICYWKCHLQNISHFVLASMC